MTGKHNLHEQSLALAQRRVDARDVLDPNAKTRRPFGGRIVGEYRRVGPNPWDAYEYFAMDGGAIDVLPGLNIQLEPVGAVFRMRRAGRVIVVEWSPAEDNTDKPPEGRGPRDVFLERYVSPFRNGRGIGALATIVRKLRGRETTS
ncbi:MAG: hypothetical protein KIT00_06830 [Rhodospirillales bacterium]|nr:hypothetical protein [Rhodospirillales bacterium]